MNYNQIIQILALFGGTLGAFDVSNAETVVDFEDVSLPSSTSAGDFYDGSDSAGGFVSQGVSFNNNYNTQFGSWTGWAASSSTDTTTPGFDNQYSAFPGSGALESTNFGVAFDASFGPSVVTFSQPTEVTGTYITNSTFAALSMLNGDAFAKKFGGTSEDDPDWFKLAILGKDSSGNTTGTVDFYLADYRFTDNSQDFIVDDWTWVDLTSLGTQIVSLEFELTSSDNGMFDLNTPSYFLFDNLSITLSPQDANFNGDQTVDGNDLAIWEQHFGTTSGATTQLGDADGDEDVDGRDFLVWQRQFGDATAGVVGVTIPEPSALVLLITALIVLWGSQREISFGFCR